MATIRDLSQETLSMIFKKLNIHDLESCQYVCKAWYAPAHIVSLEDIYIDSAGGIKRFIRAIDSNPDKAYLKAVKALYIAVGSNYKPKKFRLNKQLITKLFMRFPNLTLVRLDQHILLEEFNDEICKDMIKHCPKLQLFYLFNDYPQDPPPQYCSLLYRARLLLTTLEVNDTTYEPQVNTNKSILISSFPRLRELDWQFETSVQFSALLPAFQQSPGLTRLFLHLTEDSKNFAEQYLETQTEEEKNVLINRLSKVTFLCITYTSGFCPNQVKFIAEYLTGLDTLKFESNSNMMWDNTRQSVFCTTILALVRSSKLVAGFTFNSMRFFTLSNCFRELMLSVYCQRSMTSKNNSRVLELVTTDRLYDSTVANLHINCVDERGIIKFKDIRALHSFVYNLRGQEIPQYNVDVLLLEFPRKESFVPVNIHRLLKNILKYCRR